MSRVKDQYHDDIVRNNRTTRDQFLSQSAAQEEHYAEQRRHERNAKREREKNIPTAPVAEPHYEGRRKYPANPADDAERFERVCREADAESKKTGLNIVVFVNSEGNYFTWEEKYISSANFVRPLYTAEANESKKAS